MISKRTASALEPIVSNTSGATSPVGNGDAGITPGLAGTGAGAVSCGIGGSVFALVAGDAEPASSAATRFSRVPERASSGVAVCAFDET